jgi:nucleoid-associated protein YgaU
MEKKPTGRAAASPTDPAAIDRNAPLRLADAAAIAYPFGGITASGLRREAARGRLTIERTAGKDYVTLAAIDEMRARCRIEAKAPEAVAAERRDLRFVPPDRPDQNDIQRAQAAARAVIERLKKLPNKR